MLEFLYKKNQKCENDNSGKAESNRYFHSAIFTAIAR
jgi:hypothetical protein